MFRTASNDPLFPRSSAGSLIAALPATDEIGFALVAAFMALIWLRRKPARP